MTNSAQTREIISKSRELIMTSKQLIIATREETCVQIEMNITIRHIIEETHNKIAEINEVIRKS
jgi:hypothetical protein